MRFVRRPSCTGRQLFTCFKGDLRTSEKASSSAGSDDDKCSGKHSTGIWNLLRNATGISVVGFHGTRAYEQQERFPSNRTSITSDCSNKRFSPDPRVSSPRFLKPRNLRRNPHKSADQSPCAVRRGVQRPCMKIVCVPERGGWIQSYDEGPDQGRAKARRGIRETRHLNRYGQSGGTIPEA